MRRVKNRVCVYVCVCEKREVKVWFQFSREGAAAKSAKPGIKQKAVANKQLKPKKDLNSKINERLIDSIRLDSARLLGFVLFLIQSGESFQPESEKGRNVLSPLPFRVNLNAFRIYEQLALVLIPGKRLIPWSPCEVC